MYFYLIPFVPLAGFVLNGLLGKRFFSRPLVTAIGVGAIGVSFLLSAASLAFLIIAPGQAREAVLFTWIPPDPLLLANGAGALFSIDFAFHYDALAAIMCLVVTGVGFLIHVYSAGYMAHDAGYARYFAYLNFFSAAMLILVLGKSLAVMFIGWEGVGLCSYLLIGFWYDRDSAADAGKKAFITNRVGDFGFIAAMGILLATLGTLDMQSIAAAVGRGQITRELATAAALCLFVGATGKSAQIPLYTWLPDAMEGPTPVSALIHAATMVTAGVYLVARMNVLFTFSGTALAVVAITGALTAVYAATMGMVQNDIKRVLAYSTISQIGYMFMGLGVGAYAAGVFHLMTHAFFKSLLFLSAGSVIHALSGEQDLRAMGGLRHRLPATYRVFLIGALAIAGVPGLAGFFSKDEILAAAFAAGNYPVWALGLLGAGLTAFYMFRLIFLAFFGGERLSHDAAHHCHESPPVMLVPLYILAGLSIIGGYVGLPAILGGGNWFAGFLAPVTGHHVLHLDHLTEYLLMAASVGVGFAGIALAWWIYGMRGGAPAAAIARALGPLYRLVERKYRIDDFYNGVIVAGVMRLGELLGRFDLGIIDGIVNGAAAMTRRISRYSIIVDGRVLDGAVNGAGRLGLLCARGLRRLQTGYLFHYALALALGIVVIISLFIFM